MKHRQITTRRTIKKGRNRSAKTRAPRTECLVACERLPRLATGPDKGIDQRAPKEKMNPKPHNIITTYH